VLTWSRCQQTALTSPKYIEIGSERQFAVMQDYLVLHCAVQYCQPLQKTLGVCWQRGSAPYSAGGSAICSVTSDPGQIEFGVHLQGTRHACWAARSHRNRAKQSRRERREVSLGPAIKLNRRSATCGGLIGWRPLQNVLSWQGGAIYKMF